MGQHPEQAHSMRVAQLVLLLLFGIALVPGSLAREPIGTAASATDSVSGKYEGVAKGTGAETKLTLEISDDQGKLSGRLITPQGELTIAEGTFTNGKLSLKLSKEKTASTLNANLVDDRLTGEWVVGGETLAIELKKVPSIAEAASLVAAATSTVSLNGEWEGVADTQGQSLYFSLILKVEGEKVTGESSSALGAATISNGSFKDGKLVFELVSQGGPIYLNAVLKDGGLVGEYDYAGLTQGRWVAKKKNP
jgi:hypothetical protein